MFGPYKLVTRVVVASVYGRIRIVKIVRNNLDESCALSIVSGYDDSQIPSFIRCTSHLVIRSYIIRLQIASLLEIAHGNRVMVKGETQMHFL